MLYINKLYAYLVEFFTCYCRKIQIADNQRYRFYHFPMQHVELFNYESLTLKTVENLFSSSRR